MIQADVVAVEVVEVDVVDDVVVDDVVVDVVVDVGTGAKVDVVVTGWVVVLKN